METAYTYFYEVAKLGSIRQAAERLHVSASSISRQIAKLEHSFGAPLLIRHAHGIKLTPAGRLVAQFVQSRSREVQRLQASIDALKNLESGHVTLYTVEGMLGGFLPQALAAFSARHPRLTYEVFVSGTDDVMQAVAEDRCDIGISFHPHPRSEVETVAHIRQPLLAVMSPRHRLAQRPKLKMADLAGEPVGLPDPTFGIRHLMDYAMKADQVDLVIRLETNSIDLVRKFAVLEMGITFLPAFAFERELKSGALVGVPLANPVLSAATTQICKRSEIDLPLPAQRLLDSLIEASRVLR